MPKTTDLILAAGLGGHMIRDLDLANALPGTPASRYGRVNKALKAKELIRLRRGFYVTAKKNQPQAFSQYYLANRMVPFSFVTAESALSFHGWIPERVTSVLSLSAFGRNTQFDTPYGRFIYHTTPTPPAQFLLGVNLLKMDQHFVWIASPLRALLDLIQWHKLNAVDTHFLEHSLRIESEHFLSIPAEEIAVLQAIYTAPRIQKFLDHLQAQVSHATSHH